METEKDILYERIPFVGSFDEWVGYADLVIGKSVREKYPKYLDIMAAKHKDGSEWVVGLYDNFCFDPLEKITKKSNL